MAFYDLSKEKRTELVVKISKQLEKELHSGIFKKTISYFEDEDTYLRKSAYLSIGRIYFSNKNLQNKIVKILKQLLEEKDFKIRQTVINAAGEIGK